MDFVQGVSSYIVQLRGSGFYWRSEVTDTEIQYTGTQPLLADSWYSVIVEVDNGRISREEDIAGLGFSPLSPDETNIVTADADRLSKFNLPEESKAYALAQLYTRYNLISEAIMVLETLTNQGTMQSAIYRMQGDLKSFRKALPNSRRTISRSYQASRYYR